LNPQFDDHDRSLLAMRVEAWDKRTGPRVGDFIEMRDGTTHRLAYDLGDRVQTTCRNSPGSFCFCEGGTMRMSGRLDPAIRNEDIEDTGNGWAWFFHHDFRDDDSAVHFTVTCRIYGQVSL
jgi:hypothetical protein